MAPGLFVFLALVAGWPGRADTAQDLKPWGFQHGACADERMGALVGLQRDEALRQVRGMNLQRIRILHPQSVVTLEAVPSRLTLVIAEDGVVTRAFCR